MSAKDAALWLLKQLSVKGGVGKVLEYFGEGVENLSVPQRATIANMGAEMGATSSVFPADYEAISAGDELMMEDAPGQLLGGDGTVRLRNLTTGRDIPGTVSFTDKELELLLAGGLLPYIHNRHNGGVKP